MVNFIKNVDEKRGKLQNLFYAIEFFSIINQEEGLDVMEEFYHVAEDYQKHD